VVSANAANRQKITEPRVSQQAPRIYDSLFSRRVPVKAESGLIKSWRDGL